MAGKIVVGIDEAEHAGAALRWAVEEARLRDATVEAVHVWAFVPTAGPIDAGIGPMTIGDPTDLLEVTERAAHDEARALVASVLGDDHDVAISVVHGEPAEALLAAAEDAELLVVGNRARGSLAQALLGSTSARVSDRASCPVVVVRGDAPNRAATGRG